VEFLEEVRSRMNLVGEWVEMAAGGGLGKGRGRQGPECTHWLARRLLVLLEAEVVGAGVGGGREGVEAQARRLVPLCGPGEEEAAKRLVLACGVGRHAALAGLYAGVLCDGAALGHAQALAAARRPSARASLLLLPALKPPQTLLPLPPHWLLLPLGSEPGTDHGLTRRLLASTLALLHNLPGYTPLLPPGLVLYHALCVCLAPAEALAHDDVAGGFLKVARAALGGALGGGGGDLRGALEAGARLAGEGRGLEALLADLLGAVVDGGQAPLPCVAWALRLLLRRAWPAPERVRAWRDLRKAGLLRALDQGGADEPEPAAQYLEPPDVDAEFLGECVEALCAAPLPVSRESGGLAWLIAVHHLATHLFGAEGPLREAQRARLTRLVLGAEADTLAALLVHRSCGASGGSLSKGSVREAVDRLAVAVQAALGGQQGVIGDRERAAMQAVGTGKAREALEEKCAVLRV
jgi:hypothetical protein